MKVFISWSGETSHQVAKEIRGWLPSVIQSIRPYVSSEDIDKGARWSSDIAGELDDSAFGILCVTQENVDAPWLNFEAGALGKSIDKSKVCPFLFRIKRSDVKGPILQYQSTIHNKEDVYKLLKSINDACGEGSLETTRLEEIFEVWWPRLDRNLKAIVSDEPEAVTSRRKLSSGNEYVSRILEEVLEISRTNQKILRDPEVLFPSDYVRHLLREADGNLTHRRSIKGRLRVPPQMVRDLDSGFSRLLWYAKDLIDRDVLLGTSVPEIIDILNELERPIRYLAANADVDRKYTVHDMVEQF